MFDYSFAAFKLLEDDFKKWVKFFRIAFSVFSFLYLTYVLILEKGIFLVNVILAAMYIMYTTFELITLKKKVTNGTRNLTATGYRWAKLLLKAVTLASTLYNIYVATIDFDGISIILATLTIIVWVLQVLLELVYLILKPRIKLLCAGVLTDVKPIINAHNLFSPEYKDWKIDNFDFTKESDILFKKIQATKKEYKEKRKLKSPFTKKKDNNNAPSQNKKV